ncbi:hypothetical protein [Streptomyces sp. NPDC007206]|uniref:hypothetical protein n=1 Tax=Streptomyces sp. NPDC007206 TaxID=3154317 RepID=UPI0033E84C22
MLGFGNTTTCEECGDWLTGRQRRFCSDKCKMRAFRREKDSKPPEKVCRLCGATFRPLRGKQTYCDFQNDASESCARMQDELARRRLDAQIARDDRKCEHCGNWAGNEGNVGRPRRFCSNRCKTAHYRAEKRSKSIPSTPSRLK